MRIVGVDPSLTATGVCSLLVGPEGTSSVHGFRLPTSGRKYETTIDRWERLQRITGQLHDWTHGAALVVIEGGSYESRHGKVLDRNGLWWRIADKVLDADIPLAVAPPTTVKKFATGTGTATKPNMLAAAQRTWERRFSNDHNIADAVHLASMGLVKLGLPHPYLDPAGAAKSLAGVEWPINLECAQGTALELVHG